MGSQTTVQPCTTHSVEGGCNQCLLAGEPAADVMCGSCLCCFESPSISLAVALFHLWSSWHVAPALALSRCQSTCSCSFSRHSTARFHAHGWAHAYSNPCAYDFMHVGTSHGSPLHLDACISWLQHNLVSHRHVTLPSKAKHNIVNKNLQHNHQWRGHRQGEPVRTTRVTRYPCMLRPLAASTNQNSRFPRARCYHKLRRLILRGVSCVTQ